MAPPVVRPPNLRSVIASAEQRLFELERRRLPLGGSSSSSSLGAIPGHIKSDAITGDGSNLDGDQMVPFTYGGAGAEFGGDFGTDGNWITVSTGGAFAVTAWGFIEGETTPGQDGRASIVVREIGGVGFVRYVRQGVPYHALSFGDHVDPVFTVSWVGLITPTQEFAIQLFLEGGIFEVELEVVRFG